MSRTEENKRIFSSIAEILFNQRAIDRIEELIAPDYIEHVPLPPGWPTGIEAFRLYTVEVLNAFPDIRVTVTEIMGEGDEKVAGRVLMTGTHLGAYMGIPASGRRITWTESHFGRIVDGRLVEHWGDWNELTMLEQMGVIQLDQPTAA